MEMTKSYHDFLQKELSKWYEEREAEFDPEKIVGHAIATADHTGDVEGAMAVYPNLVKQKLEELEKQYQLLNN